MIERDLMPPEEQARILADHAARPRRKALLPGVPSIGTRDLEGFSDLQMQVLLEGDKFKDVRFEGQGTKVFVASASILSDWLVGKSFDDYKKLLDLWQKILDQIEVVDHVGFLGDVRALEYVVRNRPDRVREILVPWTMVGRLVAGALAKKPVAAA